MGRPLSRHSLRFPCWRQRLILRGHRPGGFRRPAALWADPAVTRHIVGKPSTRKNPARFICYVSGHWALKDMVSWAIEFPPAIGSPGFADFKRQMEPSLGDAPEIGWVLAGAAHGKGAATEAVQAIVAWGDQQPLAPDGLHRARKIWPRSMSPGKRLSRASAALTGRALHHLRGVGTPAPTAPACRGIVTRLPFGPVHRHRTVLRNAARNSRLGMARSPEPAGQGDFGDAGRVALDFSIWRALRRRNCRA